MTPQIHQKLPSNHDTTTSKYWDTRVDAEESTSPPRKKRATILGHFDHGRAGATTTPPPPLGGLPYPPDLHSFKQRVGNAFEFRSPEAPDVKEEPQGDEDAPRTSTLTKHFSATKISHHRIAAKTTSSAQTTRHTTQTFDVTTNDPRQRSAVIATLVCVWDGAVTAAAVSLVLRWARQVTPSRHGDIYDPAFIQGIIADLDAEGIEPQRRTVLTTMLARPLQQQLESLRSSSESLQSCLASITTPQPSSPLSKRSSE